MDGSAVWITALDGRRQSYITSRTLAQPRLASGRFGELEWQSQGPNLGDQSMLLTPPSRATFIIAIVLAIIALLVQYASARIPMASGHAFETLLLAFIVLVAGNLFRDI